MTEHAANRVPGGEPGMGAWHASPELLRWYVTGSSEMTVGLDELWALEAHLEGCASCREGLAGVSAGAPDVVSVLDRVQVGLAAGLSDGQSEAAAYRKPSRWSPAAFRDRWPFSQCPFTGSLLSRWALSRWAAPAALPWLAATVTMLLLAVGVDLVSQVAAPAMPSLVLLAAPVIPLLGVAMSWSRRMDPAHELVAASSRAGPRLVLRRTLAVLVVVVPGLALASGITHVPLTMSVLPCLAFTAATLALGDLVGMARAAAGLAAGWTCVVTLPALITSGLPVLLEPASRPGWAVLTLVALAVAVLRRDAYRHSTGAG